VIALLLLALQSCGTSSALHLYDPVSVDVWSPPARVQVISSKGYRGQSCCDVHHEGGRYIKIVARGLDAGDTEAVTVSSLREQGWTDARCVDWVDNCLQRDGVFVAVRTLPSKAMAAVEMHFERLP
jgi:hypothetical protein